MSNETKTFTMQLLPLDRVKKIYENHLSLWGIGREIGKFHEEAGELMQALNKHKKNPNEQNKSKVIGEIADVLIAVEKLEHAFGSDLVQAAKKERILKMEQKTVNEKFKRFETMKKLEASMDPERFKLWQIISDAGKSPLESQIDDVIAAVKVYCRPQE